MGSVWENATEDCNEPVLLNVIEVAKILGLGRSKIYEMISNGELPVVRIGTVVRIPKRPLMDWIERHTKDAA